MLRGDDRNRTTNPNTTIIVVNAVDANISSNIIITFIVVIVVVDGIFTEITITHICQSIACLIVSTLTFHKKNNFFELDTVPFDTLITITVVIVYSTYVVAIVVVVIVISNSTSVIPIITRIIMLRATCIALCTPLKCILLLPYKCHYSSA